MNTKRLITLALGCTMLAGPAYLAAQQDDSQESVVDAARKAQANRKDAPKAKMTIDNDNLGTLTGAVNVVGEEPAPPEDQTKKATDDKNPKKPVAKDETYWRDKFAAANKKLQDDSHELDITQREFNLKQEQFYTDPMASLKQDYSRQDLNDTRTKIDQLTATVAQDKTDISNLEDELRQAGGDPGWATPPSNPAPAPDSTTPSAPSTPSTQPAQSTPSQP
jgi:predicted RNase H-like nuclease (RuvC/YqgF family)